MIPLQARSVRGICLLTLAMVLSACQTAGQTTTSESTPPPKPVGPPHISFSAPVAWGGQARCMPDGCKLVLVEHEAGQVVLHEFKGRSVHELDRQPVAYHPDSAKWLTDSWVVAAVERDFHLEFFTVDQAKLVRQHRILVDFPPRDVTVVAQKNDAFTLLATPYSGKQIAVVEWKLGEKTARVTKVDWCDAPWHPASVTRAPNGRGPGAVVACLRDKKLLYVDAKNWAGAPSELASFDAVARQAKPSPTGKWVYVALETGRRTARVNMDTGEVQYLSSPLTGAVSVAPLSDDLVIWGEADSLYLHRYDSAGQVQETRWLRASGFPTELQLMDLDGDGALDLLILNSAGKVADVYYGPIWDQALEKL